MPDSLSLFVIEDSLRLLIQARESAEIDGDESVLKLIDDNLQEYFTREVKKVDAIAGAIRAYTQAAESLKAEEDRLRERRKRFEGTISRIKENALRAMQTHGVTKLETPTTTLRIQKNGGLQALIVKDPLDVPLNLQSCMVAMDGVDWDKLRNSPLVLKMKSVCIKTCLPDEKAIREQIKHGAAVPGAELLPRGEHLRVE